MQALVAEQIAYYRAHAPDYDVAYLGQDWDECIEELPAGTSWSWPAEPATGPRCWPPAPAW